MEKIETILNVLGWIAAFSALVGAFLNVRRKRAGFYFYLVANTILIYVGFMRGEAYNVALFSIFVVIAIYGLCTWDKE